MPPLSAAAAVFLPAEELQEARTVLTAKIKKKAKAALARNERIGTSRFPEVDRTIITPRMHRSRHKKLTSPQIGQHNNYCYSQININILTQEVSFDIINHGRSPVRWCSSVGRAADL